MKAVDPSQTPRAQAFALWMNAPMPMVTLTKTLDVTHLVKLSRKPGWKLNLLLCWCIGQAAAQIEEFYLLPVGQTLMQYERLAVNTVVAAKNNSINTCDIPFSQDPRRFREDYLRLTRHVRDTCANYELEDCMVIGTSALPQTELDAIVNIYAGCYNNPFLTWGRYRKGLVKTTLPVSFQFHHTQMDGAQAAQFLERLQKTADTLRLHTD